MRVWVGCLGCYNGGDLVGDWAGIADADPVSMGLAEHRPGGYSGPFCKRCGADEFWCFDAENLAPFIDGECSPAAATQLAEQLDGLDDDDLRLVRLYVGALGRGNWSGEIDWADVAAEARDHYVGEAESRADWAASFAEETGTLRSLATIDDVILRNIDWAGVAEEWTQGYSEIRDDERGTVVLFS